MWGQWIGFISGTNNGSVMLNIDADSPNSGKLIVFDYDKIKVSFSVDIHFEVDERNLIGKLSNFSLISYSVDPSKRGLWRPDIFRCVERCGYKFCHLKSPWRGPWPV